MKIQAFAVTLAAAAFVAGAAPAASGLKTAVFAGGCFWSMEKGFETTPGVVSAVSGYSGGSSTSPTYENHAGHLEAVKVTYDPAKISYAQLVDSYYHHIDPTDPYGQICDKGPSYKLAVFTANAEERAVAEAAKAKYGKELGAPITVATRNAAPFYNAEGYHQDYYKKNPAAYERYRIGCGRPQALRAVWGGKEAH
ncbi:peptide-methionine (S)-S-oxide reductase MsrA [Phenylobacterium sp.]|uniref:peptide-methionine (S)-S-oxide reductase MsrA n=1 Tax=Phenylobacterium sp. TaxID=1871053 RepID=UPI0025FA4ACD|nr:peptide-methionine (S)-S-oxide reductase MsrA [Phenylobacterium sp.]MBX3483903.1 peptide-methionine (S)-S-oxide reductase MsrA [Phenylobacterium sp.]MCW5759508.1 peptide-methionine (S)-S-oxide reductase MsrA [Phenylobacterium sp.]